MSLFSGEQPQVEVSSAAEAPATVIKALTIWQPWAECIARGTKRIENRTRPFHYRGPLAIHAGRRLDRYAELHPLVRATIGDEPIHALPGGVVLAVAELVDCHADAGCCRPWGEPGVYHLVLARIRRLPRPIRARGERGLWDISLGRLVGAAPAARPPGVGFSPARRP
jgi:hypothetical protein